MSENRALSWGLTAAAAAAVLLTAACGGKDVTFTPAANGSAVVQPADGSAPASTSGDAAAPASAVATPANIVITTQGSSICVRDKDSGSQACVSRHGTAVVNGVVIVDGKVVSTTGSSGGGSVVVNGGNVVVGGDGTPPVKTSGKVTLTGAVQWTGSATGTCRRNGEVRQAVVDLASGGRLDIDVVGSGVVRIELASGGDTYSGNWVGDGGIVSMAGKSLTVNGARVGRGANTVQVTATLDC